MSAPIVDLSNNNQGLIDWHKLAGHHLGVRELEVSVGGVGGIIHKLTEGVGFVDAKCAVRRALAKTHGIPFGLYHFAHLNENPVAQARHFLDCTLNGVHVGARGCPHLYVDVETGDPATAAVWTRAFNREVHDQTGVWPVFYSYRDYIDRMRLDRPLGGGLWLADYGRNNGRIHAVQPPHPWKTVRLHQFTSNGRMRGIPGLVDLSQGRM